MCSERGDDACDLVPPLVWRGGDGVVTLDGLLMGVKHCVMTTTAMSWVLHIRQVFLACAVAGVG